MNYVSAAYLQGSTDLSAELTSIAPTSRVSVDDLYNQSAEWWLSWLTASSDSQAYNMAIHDATATFAAVVVNHAWVPLMSRIMRLLAAWRSYYLEPNMPTVLELMNAVRTGVLSAAWSDDVTEYIVEIRQRLGAVEGVYLHDRWGKHMPFANLFDFNGWMNDQLNTCGMPRVPVSPIIHANVRRINDSVANQLAMELGNVDPPPTRANDDADISDPLVVFPPPTGCTNLQRQIYEDSIDYRSLRPNFDRAYGIARDVLSMDVVSLSVDDILARPSATCVDEVLAWRLLDLAHRGDERVFDYSTGHLRPKCAYFVATRRHIDPFSRLAQSWVGLSIGLADAGSREDTFNRYWGWLIEEIRAAADADRFVQLSVEAWDALTDTLGALSGTDSALNGTYWAAKPRAAMSNEALIQLAREMYSANDDLWMVALGVLSSMPYINRKDLDNLDPTYHLPVIDDALNAAFERSQLIDESIPQ